MLKRFLFAMFTLFTTLSFSSCEFEEDDDEATTEWSNLCRENSWLYEFPEFTGVFSTYQVSKSGDALIVYIDGVENGEAEFEKYAKKLLNSGFIKENEYSYSKTNLSRDYSVTTSNGVISITFAKVEM